MARLFPQRSFLNAKESSSASFEWRSILKGRDVIIKRVVWRVGDGKQIRIWGDNWLLAKNRAKITSPVIYGQESTCVEVLIDQITRSWKVDMINHVFEEANAAALKAFH